MDFTIEEVELIYLTLKLVYDNPTEDSDFAGRREIGKLLNRLAKLLYELNDDSA